MPKPKTLTVRQFEEALGGSSIYVGTSHPFEGLTGALHHRVKVAKAAREIASEVDETPIVLALRGLTQIVDGDIGYDLDDRYDSERDRLASLIGRLTTFALEQRRSLD